MRIAGVIHDSVVDGPGVRLVVFAQGCLRGCPECHNPETLDPMGGEEWSVRELFKAIRKTADKVKGFTLSGGEPFLQAGELAELAALVRRRGLHVVTYTGYVYEDLLEMTVADPGIDSLLRETDILIDGSYVKALRDIGLRFRGSENQRIIDVKMSRKTGETVLAELP